MRVLIDTKIKVDGTEHPIKVYSVRPRREQRAVARAVDHFGAKMAECALNMLRSVQGEDNAEAAKKFALEHKLDQAEVQVSSGTRNTPLPFSS